MYRELRCQHHLIQTDPQDVPRMPALTPVGFERWMVTMIEAHPDQEFERLRKAVLHMPISNADDCRERFPKELSRRLFPKAGNLRAQQRCAAALGADPVAPVPDPTLFPPPPPAQQYTSPANSINLERERAPYSDHPRTYSVDVPSQDEENSSSAIPIERERKPYSAQPGGGKIYEPEKPHAGSESRRKRSDSTTSHGSWADSARQKDQGPFGPIPRIHRSNSNAKSRRPRSPPHNMSGHPSHQYTRSENAVGDIPSHYHSSNLYSGPGDEEDRKYSSGGLDAKRSERLRRLEEDDPRYGRGGGHDDEQWSGWRPGASSGGYGSPPGPYGGPGYPPSSARY